MNRTTALISALCFGVVFAIIFYQTMGIGGIAVGAAIGLLFGIAMRSRDHHEE